MTTSLRIGGALFFLVIGAVPAWPGANEGACCIPGSTCRYVLSEAECSALGGAFLGLNTNCNVNGQDNCAPYHWGACCTGPICVVTTPAACSQGAVWVTERPCVANPCPSLGACCASDGSICVMTLPDGCRVPKEWHAAGVTCAPNTCPQANPTDRITWGRIKDLYR